jgi:hypothetical protein
VQWVHDPGSPTRFSQCHSIHEDCGSTTTNGLGRGISFAVRNANGHVAQSGVGLNADDAIAAVLLDGRHLIPEMAVIGTARQLHVGTGGDEDIYVATERKGFHDYYRRDGPRVDKVNRHVTEDRDGYQFVLDVPGRAARSTVQPATFQDRLEPEQPATTAMSPLIRCAGVEIRHVASFRRSATSQQRRRSHHSINPRIRDPADSSVQATTKD